MFLTQGPVLKALYTSLPLKYAHSNTILLYLGSSQPHFNHCIKIFVHLIKCPLLPIAMYSLYHWLNWGNMVWTKLSRLWNCRKSYQNKDNTRV